MGGGLLQLVSRGQIDEYLTGNPQISFYEYVFKRHTNFSMESRNLDFISNKYNKFRNTTGSNMRCQIKRHGDLLGNIFFCFTLPPVYSSDKYRFRWVKNIGNIIMKEATVTIDGGIVIDKITGEWMNIWNELTTISDKYDKMIGNVQELTNPRVSNDRITIKNNKFIYYYYPESIKPSIAIDTIPKPSIPSRDIVVPLNFWFTKTPALALPLLRLQLYQIEVSIDLELSDKLFQIYSDELNEYVSPTFYNEIYPDNPDGPIDISYFLDESYDLKPFIEANYIFLDNEERLKICYKPSISYLAEQTKHTVRTGIISNENIELNANLPIKEFVWVFRRDDWYRFNDFTNYSPTFPESNKGILDKASIRFFNNIRLEEKPATYFNMIQPYQHHTTVPKKGIYCYSFANFPEKDILSGYFNGAYIKTNMNIWVEQNRDSSYLQDKFFKAGLPFYSPSFNFNYDVSIYSLGYNIFEVVGGQANMKFST